MIKAGIIALWLGSLAYIYFRGKVRLSFFRTVLNHTALLAPVNAFMYLFSAVPAKPYISDTGIKGLAALDENWETIREEAANLAQAERIRAAADNNDAGFNSFFKAGWKRFYLKWYEAEHPSAAELCPKTVDLLRQIPEVKAALVAGLPPGAKLNPHRDPYAGSI